MQIAFFGTTDVGLIRQENEDNLVIFLLNPATGAVEELLDGKTTIVDSSCIGLFVVADGMGGAAAGEIASKIAIETVREVVEQQSIPVGNDPGIIGLLKNAVMESHFRIVKNAEENAGRLGMGTTLTIGVLTENKLYLAWSGDSRCYRFSPKGVKRLKPYDLENLEILTPDHSVVWEMVERGEITSEQARTHHQSNVITQSLGEKDFPPNPDFRIIDVFKEDQLLFCSDGLNGMMADFYISQILSQKKSPEKSVASLLSAAKAGGGTDNITLILIEILEGKTNAGVLEKAKTEAVDTKKVEIQTNYVYKDGSATKVPTQDAETPTSGTNQNKGTGFMNGYSAKSKAFFFTALVMVFFTGFLYYQFSERNQPKGEVEALTSEKGGTDTLSSEEKISPDTGNTRLVVNPDEKPKKEVKKKSPVQRNQQTSKVVVTKDPTKEDEAVNPDKPVMKDSTATKDTIKKAPFSPAIQSILEKIKSQSNDLENLLQQAKGVLQNDNVSTKSPNLIPQVNSLVKEIEVEIKSLQSYRNKLLKAGSEGKPIPAMNSLDNKIETFKKRLAQLEPR